MISIPHRLHLRWVAAGQAAGTCLATRQQSGGSKSTLKTRPPLTESVQKKRTMSSILVDSGIVTPDQVEEAYKRQLGTGRLIGESLVELGFTTEENIAWALSKQLGIPFADVQPGTVDPQMVKHFPEMLLRRFQAAPLFRSQEEIVIAMADPSNRDSVAALREAAGTQLSLVIGCPASIRRVLDSVFGPDRGAENPPRFPDIEINSKPHAEAELTGDSGANVVWDRAGATFLLYHLHAARDSRASEIHFIPTPTGLSVFYRTDGGLEQRGLDQPEASLYLRTRLAYCGAPDLQPGHATSSPNWVTVALGAEQVHVGVFHCRMDGGVTTVLRLAPATLEAPELSTLGLSPIGEAEIRDFIEGPEGLIIVHGPPRSGGSTVLASLAALAARPRRRTLVFEPSRVAPYPPGTARLQAPAGSAMGSGWERLAVALGADVLVLDEIALGEAVTELLGGACVGRLVFARTDWLDGRRLLAFLAASRNGRAVLRDRPFAMIALPAVRREGSSVWTTPLEAESHAGILETFILTDEGRDSLLAGSGV